MDLSNTPSDVSTHRRSSADSVAKREAHSLRISSRSVDEVAAQFFHSGWDAPLTSASREQSRQQEAERFSAPVSHKSPNQRRCADDVPQDASSLSSAQRLARELGYAAPSTRHVGSQEVRRPSERSGDTSMKQIRQDEPSAKKSQMMEPHAGRASQHTGWLRSSKDDRSSSASAASHAPARRRRSSAPLCDVNGWFKRKRSQHRSLTSSSQQDQSLHEHIDRIDEYSEREHRGDKPVEDLPMATASSVASDAMRKDASFIYQTDVSSAERPTSLDSLAHASSRSSASSATHQSDAATSLEHEREQLLSHQLSNQYREVTDEIHDRYAGMGEGAYHRQNGAIESTHYRHDETGYMDESLSLAVNRDALLGESAHDDGLVQVAQDGSANPASSQHADENRLAQASSIFAHGAHKAVHHARHSTASATHHTIAAGKNGVHAVIHGASALKNRYHQYAQKKAAQRKPGAFHIGIFGVQALVVMGLVVFCIAMLYGPSRSYYQEYRAHQRLESKYAQLNEYRNSLETSVKNLQTPEGIEDAAREELGMVLEDEHSVRVTGLPPEEEHLDIAQNIQGKAPVTWWSKMLDALFFLGDTSVDPAANANTSDAAH